MEKEPGQVQKARVNSIRLKQKELVYRVRDKVRLPLPIFRMLHRGQESFVCPICSYSGPFATLFSFAGPRKNAVCPQCRSFERHRLQYLAMQQCFAALDAEKVKVLHVAPEKFLGQIFAERFQNYETADLFMQGVDHKVDLQNLPFQDGSYDLIFASHVLEHITHDKQAIAEIRRVLRPGGMAILPVPIVSPATVEYPEPNPHEAGHVRAPGLDYFDKYREFFSRVEIFGSEAFPDKHQVFVYEDRSNWPTPEFPRRLPMQGARHADYVPVCYV